MTASDVAAVLAALVLALVVTAVIGASRLRVLSRRVGAFECAARPGDGPDGSWVAGIAHYGAGRIDWWRSWSLAPRPSLTWRRDELRVVSKAPSTGPDNRDQFVVRCRCGDRELELTMSCDAFAGLTAWLEAAPPSGLSRVI